MLEGGYGTTRFELSLTRIKRKFKSKKQSDEDDPYYIEESDTDHSEDEYDSYNNIGY